MRVTLYDLSYTVPDHLDVLLVGPGGQKFVLMGDAGGAIAIPAAAPVTLSFRDIGPGVRELRAIADYLEREGEDRINATRAGER